MRFKNIILFIAAALILSVIGAIALSYLPVQVPAITALPDPIVLTYRDQRTECHRVSISSSDPEYKHIQELFANPGRARFLDPIDYMGEMWIDTPTLRISLVGDSLLLFQYHKNKGDGWSNNTRRLTASDREVFATLRARCERDAGSSFKPRWIR